MTFDIITMKFSTIDIKTHVVAEIDVRDMLGQPNTTLLQQYDVSECVNRELVLEFVGSLGK